MQRLFNLRLAFLAILLVSTTFAAVRAAEILDEVPNDALGFVLVHNLANVDAKVGRLAGVLRHSLPRPLAFLREFAGVSEGLKTDGDFLLALFPDGGDNSREFRYCVWLPISDYDRFLRSTHATSHEGVAAATIAGEDLLVARHGEWALIMDPDQRERLAELASASPSPPQMPAWKPWINSNDLTVVAFAPGMREIQAWIEYGGDDDEKSSNGRTDDNPFGAITPDNDDAFVVAKANRAPTGTLEIAKSEFRKWAAAAPELTQFMQQIAVAGCGIRLDDNGHAFAGLRVAVNKDVADELTADKNGHAAELPFSMLDSNVFAISGAGRVPQSLLTTAATAYVRRTATDLLAEEKTELEDSSLKQLQDAVEQAASQVQSISMLSQPGEEPQPVYTNEFIALRVASASKFLEHANEVMRLWNKANRDAKGDTHMVFAVEESKVGDHAATQYALDVASLDGAVVAPEVRQAMEKLFGPGGKLRFWLTATDDNTVLLAAATPEQVAAVVKQLERKQPTEWKSGGVGACNALLPADADWQIFVDPHRYNEWMRRQTAAMIGVPVIGGPLVRDFPASPPVGIAGGIRDGELWVDAVALAPTLKSTDEYLARTRVRGPLQFKARIVAPGNRPPGNKPN